MQVALLEFLQSLGARRAAKGVLSNKELAKLVGVSPPTLSRWLNGNENITISTMCRLATALGAAVHIHVVDNTKKGGWKEEPGEARNESRSGITTVRGPVEFAAYRNAKAALAVTQSGSSVASPEPIAFAGWR
jgi:transcriptional regulator with XRE-family HTH domain